MLVIPGGRFLALELREREVSQLRIAELSGEHLLASLATSSKAPASYECPWRLLEKAVSRNLSQVNFWSDIAFSQAPNE